MRPLEHIADNPTRDVWSVRLTSSRPEATDELARTVARHVSIGSIILLDGELAAGKTHFVKALVRALGSTDAVTSPSYALVHFYDCPTLKVVHVDAYRLLSAAEYDDLGLDDYRDDGLTVVEWGRLVESRFDDPLIIELAFIDSQPDSRSITLTARGHRWGGLHADLLRRRMGGRE